MAMEEAVDDYTQDGSVDLKGNPVRRSKSGGWTAYLFIVAGAELAVKIEQQRYAAYRRLMGPHLAFSLDADVTLDVTLYDLERHEAVHLDVNSADALLFTS